jgi:hypothetical protein
LLVGVLWAMRKRVLRMESLKEDGKSKWGGGRGKEEHARSDFQLSW